MKTKIEMVYTLNKLQTYETQSHFLYMSRIDLMKICVFTKKRDKTTKQKIHFN